MTFTCHYSVCHFRFLSFLRTVVTIVDQTPAGIEHYTLWSIYDLSHQEIVTFVDAYLRRHMPHVRRWNYDDNLGDRSIDLFHIHVYIETNPPPAVSR